MAEAFGLDRKIENYKGTRPITLYRWDLDCLMDVIDLALKDERDYPDKSTPEYQALQRVGERIHQEYDAVYGHEKIARPGKVATPAKRLATSSPAAAPGQKPEFPKAPSKSSKSESCLPTQDHPGRHQAPGLATSRGHGLHLVKAPRDHPDRHGLGRLPPVGLRDRRRPVRRRPRRRHGHGEQPQTQTEPGRPAGVKKFRYTYDFGDHWEHVIQVEKVLEAEPKVQVPPLREGQPCLPAGRLRRRLGLWRLPR